MNKVALLPGDGIGPEIIDEAVKVLKAVEKRFGIEFEFVEGLVGGASLDTCGLPISERLDLCMSSDAVLFGAVGGPK